MDQIKKLMAWAKINRFWLGSALTAITMTAAWFFVSSLIAKTTQKNTETVKQNITKASGILNVSADEGVKAHPNTSTEKGMAELLSKSVDELIKAWEIRYNSQVKILKWPKELQERKKFTDLFDVHNPPETFPWESERGIEDLSTLYRNEIPRQMERICAEKLKAKWNYDPKLAETKLTADEELSRFAVVWDPKNQKHWYDKLRNFRGYDDHAGIIDGPTALQIYMLQQDLWLLEAMFDVIREVNGDVSSNDLAKIKKIDHVVFGRETGRDSLGKLSPIRMPASVISQAEISAPAPVAPETAFNPNSSKKAFHGRYVTSDYKPIPAETVLKVIEAVKTNGPLPEGNLELIVAKRVPVRIALRMDEREIPDFIKACANSPFAFEIQQVRKNRHVPGEGIVLNGGDRGGQSFSVPDLGGGEGRGVPVGESGGPGDRGGNAGAGEQDVVGKIKSEVRVNYDIDVEFYGIVRIYNPVDSETEGGFRGGQYLRKIVNADNPQASNVTSPVDRSFASSARN